MGQWGTMGSDNGVRPHANDGMSNEMAKLHVIIDAC